MRCYLVVAHRTLGGEHLFSHMRTLREEHPCRFHIVVPVDKPSDHSWSEGEIEAIARERLDEMLENLAAMGIGADGEIGDANPVYAVGIVLRRDGTDAYTGIIVSTLPTAVSRWLKIGVPQRLADAYPMLPVTHVPADELETAS